MKRGLGILGSACIFLPSLAAQPPAAAAQTIEIPLTVPAGAPLRLYLTRRVSKRAGAPVEGKLMEPVFAFDREVVPAGSILAGQVSRIRPRPKWQRIQAIVNGDLTPPVDAEIEFNTLTLPHGRTLSIHTVDATPLDSIYTEPAKRSRRKASPANPNGGILGTARQAAKDQVNSAINARTHGIADIVRSPNKKEKLVDFLWAKLPYHPRYVRRGTRVDAPLRDPLSFGAEAESYTALAELGSQPGPGSMVRARLVTALDSASAAPGQPVAAIVTAPLFSADHKLVLPEGTRLTGAITVAKKGRSFHRAGQLRFVFQDVALPPAAPHLPRTAPLGPRPPVLANLQSAESGGPAPIKVDAEGGVQAQETKTRFIAPLISLVLASKAADNDAGRHNAGSAGGEGNVSGRTLGGASGFGLAGAALAQSSRYVGMAFGYYGLAWSVYSSVVAKGGEVRFDRNAMVEIQFGARPTAPAAK